MAEFVVGDLVCLKSGGPTMTVNGISTDGETVYCRWFAGSKAQSEPFNVGALVKVEEEEGEQG